MLLTAPAVPRVTAGLSSSSVETKQKVLVHSPQEKGSPEDTGVSVRGSQDTAEPGTAHIRFQWTTLVAQLLLLLPPCPVISFHGQLTADP